MHRITMTCSLATLAAIVALGGCEGADPANALINSKKTGEHMAAKLAMKGLADAMFAQESSGGVWPTSLEEFVADGTVKPSDIRDPWGNDYMYAPPATRSDDKPVLYSFGPDGEPETADDIHHEWQ